MKSESCELPVLRITRHQASAEENRAWVPDVPLLDVPTHLQGTGCMRQRVNSPIRSILVTVIERSDGRTLSRALAHCENRTCTCQASEQTICKENSSYRSQRTRLPAQLQQRRWERPVGTRGGNYDYINLTRQQSARPGSCVAHPQYRGHFARAGRRCCDRAESGGSREPPEEVRPQRVHSREEGTGLRCLPAPVQGSRCRSSCWWLPSPASLSSNGARPFCWWC